MRRVLVVLASSDGVSRREVFARRAPISSETEDIGAIIMKDGKLSGSSGKDKTQAVGGVSDALFEPDQDEPDQDEGRSSALNGHRHNTDRSRLTRRLSLHDLHCRRHSSRAV